MIEPTPCAACDDLNPDCPVCSEGKPWCSDCHAEAYEPEATL